MEKEAMKKLLFLSSFRGKMMASQVVFGLLVWSSVSVASALAQGDKNLSSASMILEVQAEACLGQDRSREQTEKLAFSEARRNAAERAKTYISSQTSVKSGELMADIIDSYAKATVRVLDELEKGWFQTRPETGFVDSCYRVRLKAEVIPTALPSAVDTGAKKELMSPKAPLAVEIWMDKDVYHIGDTMKFFFRGNKPFYAHAVYQDAEGTLVEVTPHNQARHYEGGVIYQIPGADDSFILKITPPIGREQMILYAATQPMADYAGQAAGGMLVISPDKRPMGVATRGLAVLPKFQTNAEGGKAEFAEVKAIVRIER
jgi:hypothetical protein